MPYTNLEVRTDGTFSPCCLSTYSYKKEDGTTYNIETDSVTEVWESADRIKHANAIDNSEIATCNHCWNIEKTQGYSKRIFESDERGSVVNDTPRSLDIKFNNVCNLKCVICSPINSSLWYSDYEKLKGHKFNNSKYKWIHHVDVYDKFKIYLQHAELLEFYGGEPLLIKNHYDILKHCVDSGISKDQKIRTNTNGTVKITDELLDTYSKFKYVGLNWSIDSVIKEEFEYQRYPANFDNVISNLQYVIQNKPNSVALSITYTVNAMNILSIGEMIKFAKTHKLFLHLNLLNWPNFLNFNILPKSQIVDYVSSIDDADVLYNGITLDTIKQYHESDNRDYLAGKMKDYLTALDAIRKTDFKKTFPKLAEFLNDY